MRNKKVVDSKTPYGNRPKRTKVNKSKAKGKRGVVDSKTPYGQRASRKKNIHTRVLKR